MTDILERAKAAIAEAQSCGHTRYEELSSNALDELLPDAITEVERLQDLIDSPPEEADWLHDDARLCGEITTGVVQIARKWHSAYRKAQNSNLMRAKEVGRLRSLENCVSLVIDRQGKTNAALLGQLDVISAYLDAELVEWKNGDQIAEIAIKFMDLQKQKLNDANSQIAAKDARIKELEADRIEARAQYLLFMNDNPGCIAWNFDELDETEQDALREQARYMLELEEPWAYIQLREAREQIKRLEAAFLEAKSRLIQVTENKSNPCGLPL